MRPSSLPHLFQLRLAIVLLLATSGHALAREVAAIPRPAPGHAAVDLTGATLSPTETAALDRLAVELRAATGVELAAAIVPSVDGADPHGFATRLFNHWGLGSAARNDGLLIFVALEDHAAEIILGDGLSAPSQVEASRRVMEGVMLPLFRAGRTGEAVVEGARACARSVVGAATPQAHREEPRPPLRAEAPLPAPRHRPRPLPTVPSRAAAGGRSSPTGPPTWLPRAVAWAGIALFAVLAVALAIRRQRRLRTCPHCQGPRMRLTETDDDAHLSASERLEEELGSVNYAVWACRACGRVEKLRHRALFSRYKVCPRCQAVTLCRVSTTVRSATTWRGGLVQVDESCARCHFADSSTYSTPPLPGDDDGSDWGWSSSSSSGGSASSSFGGGSSSSGGHSSGSGASGSW